MSQSGSQFRFYCSEFRFFSPKFDFHIFEFEIEITHFPDRNSLPGVVRKRKISPKFGEIPREIVNPGLDTRHPQSGPVQLDHVLHPSNKAARSMTRRLINARSHRIGSPAIGISAPPGVAQPGRDGTRIPGVAWCARAAPPILSSRGSRLLRLLPSGAARGHRPFESDTDQVK